MKAKTTKTAGKFYYKYIKGTGWTWCLFGFVNKNDAKYAINAVEY